MTKVVIDGVPYRPIDRMRAAELAERLNTFTAEGETYWRNLFRRDHDQMYSEGDEKAPFFSEAFLYNLLGKDDARSVLGIVRHLADAAGVEWR